jgi:AhpD family alkylhydroperoxidase
MKPRFSYTKQQPNAYGAMQAAEDYLEGCSLEQQLIHLVKLRASQINGCAYCIDMHWKDLRALGETEQRLYGLNAWRETQYYSDRERAALAWTESVTLVSETHIPDDVFELVKQQFSEVEIADLTFAIAVINSWNRLSIAMRPAVGSYESAQALIL